MRDKSFIHGIIKFAVRPFFSMPIRIIALLIPKDNNLWIFGCHGGNQFIGNTLYFYNYLQEENHASKRIIITHSDKTYENLKSLGCKVLKAYSLEGLWAVARAHRCFITNFVEDDINILTISNRLKVYNLWHGIAIKKITWVRPTWMRKFLALVRWNIPSYRLFLSTFQQPVSRTPQAFNLTKKQIKPFGYPSDDLLLQSQLPRCDIKNLNWSNYTKVWLYAPTFRDTKTMEQPFTPQFLKKLDTHFAQTKQVLLIKKHPVQRDIVIDKRYRNIKDVSSQVGDIQVLLTKAHVLLTDYSSACIHFSLTGRPCLFYVYDYDSYASSVGFSVDFYKDMPGPFARNEQELWQLITSIERWSNQNTYKQKYVQFVNRYHKYKDGKSSQRLLKFVESD